jgi:alginate O-acetyltransferase complex protein AlgI
MVFASLTFLYLFLPANLVLYALLRSIDARNWLLLVFSLLFYAWGEPVWVLLLLLTSAMDWWLALQIERHRDTPRARVALVTSLVVSLGLLGVFKYAGFVVENLNRVTGAKLAVPSFTLPIGISFYTFQSISYIVDVYRGEVAAQPRFSRYLLFISLYHQLVAGPIVRYVEVAREIGDRVHLPQTFARGVSRFCVGLLKKVAIANTAGELAGRFLDSDLSTLAVTESWFGIAAYTLQIYFDFSGYSDMAIGMGWMFGFHYAENFQHPYIARSIGDFWRRWHISLSSFFRDYVYIPLGGNRRQVWRNLAVVWLLTGLWHGASWNFVLWGAYYLALLVNERLWLGRLLARLPRAVGHLYVLPTVMLGWALFYFTDLSRLAMFLRVASGTSAAPWSSLELQTVVREYALWLAVACVAVTPVRRLVAVRLGYGEAPGWLPPWLRQPLAVGGQVAAVAIATILLAGKSYNPFLYFRF